MGYAQMRGKKVALLLLDHFNTRLSVNKGWLDLVCEQVLAGPSLNRYWLDLVCKQVLAGPSL